MRLLVPAIQFDGPRLAHADIRQIVDRGSVNRRRTSSPQYCPSGRLSCLNINLAWAIVAFSVGRIFDRWSESRRHAFDVQADRQQAFEAMQRETWVRLQDALSDFWMRLHRHGPRESAPRPRVRAVPIENKRWPRGRCPSPILGSRPSLASTSWPVSGPSLSHRDLPTTPFD
jgi:hypothetical protein